MSKKLAGKVAVVTGSSRGLGLASARALVAEGCKVCLCARGEERLAEAAVEVEAAARKPGMVLTVQADVSTLAGVGRVIDRTVETFGGVDILVNNVGKAGGTDLLDTSDAEWQAAIDETLFRDSRLRFAVPLAATRGSDCPDRVDSAASPAADDLQRGQGREISLESARATAPLNTASTAWLRVDPVPGARGTGGSRWTLKRSRSSSAVSAARRLTADEVGRSSPPGVGAR